MTTADRCYVFVQLPGTLEVVPCGRFRAEEKLGVVAGKFSYLSEYLARSDAVAIDPFELPLKKGTFTTTRLNGIFGALRDASPDAWGRRVIEHVFRVNELSEVQYLLNSPEDRIGALSFSRDETSPAPVQRFNKTLQLAQLLSVAEKILDGVAPETIAQRTDLLSPGTSLGGARPKSVVEDDTGLWVAKFPLRSDRWNSPVVEAAMLSLAGKAGLQVAEHRVERVGKRDVLLVKRFDRERTAGGYLRRRMVSGLTVLQAEDAASDRLAWSYPRLADELGRWCRAPQEQRQELFRRIVFNALISNSDDHPRNHALIAPSADWHLSPAYDLTPSPTVSQERRLAMQIGERGVSATRANLLSAARRFDLTREQATTEIDRLKDFVLTHWERVVREEGAVNADVAAIASAFDYPGFEYE